MLIGGATFSTAGGIKVGRLIILYREFLDKISEKDTSAVAGLSTSASISSTANPYRSTEFLGRLQEEYRKRDLEEVFERQEKVLKRIILVAKKKVVREILTVIVL